jgi:hypothetical protein
MFRTGGSGSSGSGGDGSTGSAPSTLSTPGVTEDAGNFESRERYAWWYWCGGLSAKGQLFKLLLRTDRLKLKYS